MVSVYTHFDCFDAGLDATDDPMVTIVSADDAGHTRNIGAAICHMFDTAAHYIYSSMTYNCCTDHHFHEMFSCLT